MDLPRNAQQLRRVVLRGGEAWPRATRSELLFDGILFEPLHKQNANFDSFFKQMGEGSPVRM